MRRMDLELKVESLAVDLSPETGCPPAARTSTASFGVRNRTWPLLRARNFTSLWL